ncbi:MAG: sugar transferase [Rhodobacteraceae bacterium]|nr:sugar transferase [Paracoccaceae bacterium]
MTWQKRIFDLFFVLQLWIILTPFILGIALWLLVVQGRPVFYVSERMRSPDRAFGLVKFRTMTTVSCDSGPLGGHKSGRITQAGAWLRARRLDELPQIWNILKGDLSFVGPRPPVRKYVNLFPELYGRVLQSHPGATGLASLHFHKREELLLNRCKTIEETEAVYVRVCVPRKARLDLIYQAHSSICYDFILVMQTIRRIVFRLRRGA